MKQLAACVLALSPICHAQQWTCGAAKHSAVLTTDTRASATAAGFDLAEPPASIEHGACVSNHSFFFSVPLPEGNYTVDVELGGPEASNTTVKAEGRRLMLMPVMLAAGQHRSERFTVNIRTPQISGGGEVKRKPRELDSLRWDSKLTLEFAGDHPAVRTIQIKPAPASTITVYLAGDSTVVDQDKEPWAAWGQMLPALFDSRVAIANHAESGETIRSSTTERRFDKIFSTIKRGDYLFMQFGHNDQKPGSGYVPAETTYTDLTKRYIAMARDRGAIPVLVTSMNRRTFDEAGHIRDTLAPYPETVRKIANEEHVALIDLNAMSKTLYEAIGEPHSRELFVYAAANTYPGQTEALHDDTHFNAYGAYELARCVVLGIQHLSLPLARMLRHPNIRFDPSHPDTAASILIPPTPFIDSAKPYER